ncbi:thioredoxin domain-containing protein [Ilumatobacter sp.]|uniref:thioredoxin domain-containing protein n=1 Tax=Ilumatobacter sp. TaxID=1967498 RepID=UPI003B52E362
MNRLADETSPYLRQHRDNPVDWYPWGPEAFAAARERDVPVLLSVGYSACHWCHVMAHECFEDDEVAARMNELFVNVKVDREERPDVDQLYMDAVQAMTGRGGWPMTVFTTPDAKPFYGGTYFPRDTFLALMESVDDVYRNKPDDVATNTAALVEAIDTTAGLTPSDEIPTVEQLNTSVQTLARAFDPEWGGFGSPPKFPSTFNIELILRAYMTSGADAAKRIVETTLDAMASGGLYDHIGGGFARYSTDREWMVPHFEKMLPDQALLAQTYLHGLVVMRRPEWRQVVQETIEYVLRELRHDDGGFLSAQDADSPGPDGVPVEGLFHTWTTEEVRAALARVKPEIVAETLEWWSINDEGDLDGDGAGRNIPNRAHHRGELVRTRELEATRRLLFDAREQRPKPATDDKVLLEWNALFLSSLSQAGAVFAHRPWLDAAIANAEFLIDNMRGANGRWYRSWQADGVPPARHDALAADHAALVDAFTRLAEATGEARWIHEARATADTMLDWFFDPVEGGLFTTAEDGEHLIVRQKDLSDTATPSANSLGALALYRLASLTGEMRYRNQADRILQLLAARLEGRVGLHSNALLATDIARRGATEVVIVGDDDHDMSEFVRVAHSIWRPDVVLAWGEPYDSPLWEGRTPGHAYVCRDHVCAAPVTTKEDFIEALTGMRPATPSD